MIVIVLDTCSFVVVTMILRLNKFVHMIRLVVEQVYRYCGFLFKNTGIILVAH